MNVNILTTAGCLLVAYSAYGYWKSLRAVNFVPGYRPLFSPLTVLGSILPATWWNLGINWGWDLRKTGFFKHSHDIVTIVPLLHGQPAYITCSLEVMKQLLGNEGQRHLPKPQPFTEPFLLWGRNVFSSNHDMWKRHRRIMAPAFTTKTYATVLQQTTSLYRDMVQKEGWEGKTDFVVDSVNRLTLRIAFLVIARCGFGMQLPWASGEDAEAEDTSADHALAVVAETTILRLIMPRWGWKLPIKKLRRIDQRWKELAAFMHSSVEIRSAEVAENPDLVNERGDVFTRLVAANENDGKYTLSEDEVIGNTFMLMFAGHETTASVLKATLGYLGIYQDEQAKCYEEISSTIPRDQDLNLEHLPRLQHTLACFNEALRIYPAGNMLVREMPEDVAVKVKRPVETTLVLNKGSLVVFDMSSIFHNPHTYPSPGKFEPSRWYGIAEPDIGMFGNGPRGCIGRKFSHTEGLTFLALFLRDWHIDVVLNVNETRAQYEERVMGKAGFAGLSFGVTGEIKLRLKKRM